MVERSAPSGYGIMQVYTYNSSVYSIPIPRLAIIANMFLVIFTEGYIE